MGPEQAKVRLEWGFEEPHARPQHHRVQTGHGCQSRGQRQVGRRVQQGVPEHEEPFTGAPEEKSQLENETQKGTGDTLVLTSVKLGYDDSLKQWKAY